MCVCDLVLDLNLNTPHPSHSGQASLVQQVVCLVVKAPLTQRHCGPAVLDALDHVAKVLLLIGRHNVVRLHTVNVELVLGIGLGWLKCTGQDGNLGVFHLVVWLFVCLLMLFVCLLFVCLLFVCLFVDVVVDVVDVVDVVECCLYLYYI